MVWIAIFILTGVVYYIVRSYLENDAMVKAKYVAEDYMKSSNLLTDEEITHVLNKYEEYEAKIKELYNNVFLVELENNINKEIKSFSYNDVITKTIKINF